MYSIGAKKPMSPGSSSPCRSMDPSFRYSAAMKNAKPLPLPRRSTVYRSSSPIRKCATGSPLRNVFPNSRKKEKWSGSLEEEKDVAGDLYFDSDAFEGGTAQG